MGKILVEEMNRIDQLFNRKNSNILNVYFTAGYPKLADTLRVAEALEKAGTDILEIGIPYSDPIADGTTIKGSIQLMDGSTVDADKRFEPISLDTYYITPNKCTECQGFHEEPQCAAVCPVDCCVPDELYQETVDELMAKKAKMHI
jgi:ferredoxin